MTPRRPPRRSAALAGLVVAATVLAGCGGPGSNGEEQRNASRVIADAEAATSSATSVRVAGKGTVGTTATQIDVVEGSGRGGGTITVGGAMIQLVLDGQDFYLKTTPAVIQALTGSADTASQDANRWLKTSSSNSNVTSLLPILDLTKLASSFQFTGSPTKQAVTTFAGKQTIPIVDSAGGDTVYVAATGKPYIVGIKGSARSGGATLIYSEYGTAKIPAPPTGAIALPTPAG